MLNGKNLPHELLLTTRQLLLQQLMQELKKKRGSTITTLIISNREMNDILKTVQALEDSNILLQGVTKKINNETKEQKGGF